MYNPRITSTWILENCFGGGGGGGGGEGIWDVLTAFIKSDFTLV